MKADAQLFVLAFVNSNRLKVYILVLYSEFVQFFDDFEQLEKQLFDFVFFQTRESKFLKHDIQSFDLDVVIDDVEVVFLVKKVN